LEECSCNIKQAMHKCKRSACDWPDNQPGGSLLWKVSPKTWIKRLHFQGDQPWHGNKWPSSFL